MHVCASETPPYSVCACCDCFGVEGDAVCVHIWERERGRRRERIMRLVKDECAH